MDVWNLFSDGRRITRFRRRRKRKSDSPHRTRNPRVGGPAFVAAAEEAMRRQTSIFNRLVEKSS